MFSKFSKIWSSLDSDSSDNEQQNHAGNNNNLNRRGSRNVLSSIIFNSNRGTTAPDNSETASAADAVISGSSSVTVHPRNDRTGVGSSSLHYSQSSAPRPTLASLESSCGPRSSHAPHLVNSSDSSRGVIRQHGTLQHHMHHNIIDLNDAEIESPTFDSEDIETQRSGSPASSSRRQVLSRYSPVFTSSSPHRPSIHQQISLPIHGSSNTRRTSLQPLQFRVASVHGRSSPNRRKSLTLYNQDNIVRHQRQLPSAPAPDNSRQRQAVSSGDQIISIEDYDDVAGSRRRSSTFQQSPQQHQHRRPSSSNNINNDNNVLHNNNQHFSSSSAVNSGHHHLTLSSVTTDLTTSAPALVITNPSHEAMFERRLSENVYYGSSSSGQQLLQQQRRSSGSVLTPGGTKLRAALSDRELGMRRASAFISSGLDLPTFATNNFSLNPDGSSSTTSGLNMQQQQMMRRNSGNHLMIPGEEESPYLIQPQIKQVYDNRPTSPTSAAYLQIHSRVRRHRSLPSPTFAKSPVTPSPFAVTSHQPHRSSSFRMPHHRATQEAGGRLRVNIKKSKPLLGIAIEGGSNVPNQRLPRIISIHGSGAAFETGDLHVGHIILEVDCISTLNLPHHQIAQMIADAYYHTPHKDFIEFVVREKSKHEFDIRRSSFMLLNTSFE